MLNKKPIKVLIIDDDENVLFSLRNFLEDRYYEVVEAVDGKKGLDLFYVSNPDLVLVDLRMPEVDGLDVLFHITKDSPQIPVIIISGVGAIGDAVEALRLGAWDFILKPIHNMVFLEHALRKVLERANLRKQNIIYQKELEETLAKLREDEQAGLKIQKKLLPPIKSKLGPYVLSQKLMPSMYLSGDFVDYFKINDDCIAFYLADVSGHGVSSSLVTVLLKSFMKKYKEKFMTKNDYSIFHPGPLLTKFNEEMINEDIGKYLTLFYGVLVVPENALRFANAGQFPYPIIWSSEGVHLLEDKHKPVGLFPDIRYQETQITLPKEFTFAIFSDGILEVLKEKSIKKKLLKLNSLKTVENINAFMSKIQAECPFPDDITVLTIMGGESND